DLLPALFRHLLTWAAEGPASGVERTTAHLLAAFVGGETATDAIPAEVAPEAVGRVQAYIYDRLDLEPDAAIRLDDLAAVAGVDRAHLCRLFRATTDRTPMETVRLARLDRAATLLARSNYSIAEIAAMCGFASPFHFSRRFKESYGEPPRSLRDRVRAGAVPPEPRLLRVVRT
ncbi:MAG: helix-turn-helix transcriptional regulator, partial [Chloroflexota bacterium]|nr:helix-turn-helix transcriptional regulator [Chloroflexota bacterium]